MEDWELLGPLVWSWGVWMAGLAVTAIVLWLVIRAAQRRKDPSAGGTDDSPEAILKRRYARGELDREEYERLLEDLRR